MIVSGARRRKNMDDHALGWLAGQDDARSERPYTHDYTESQDYRDAYREGWTDVRPVPWEEYPRKVDGQLVWACCESSIGPPCEHVATHS
jgi:hypothetical protein